MNDSEIDGAGLVNTIMDVGSKVIGQLTGEAAKSLAKETGKRVAKKALEKGNEIVGSKLESWVETELLVLSERRRVDSMGNHTTI